MRCPQCMIKDGAALYSLLKHEINVMTGASQELLHVHFGLLIFILAAVLSRRGFGSPLPLVVVAIFATLNEILDSIDGAGPNQLEPIWDFLNSVFWPTMLFLLARCRGQKNLNIS